MGGFSEFADIRRYIGDRYKYKEEHPEGQIESNPLIYCYFLVVANQGLEPRTCGL